MIPGLPLYIVISFILVTLLTVWFLYRAGVKSGMVFGFIAIWLILHAVLSLNGFYTVTDTVPPRLVLMIGPPVLFILFLFASAKTRKALDKLNIYWLTWLHVVRIPVELVLFWLFIQKQIPQIMTFEGWNFDIFSGISAPFIAWLGFQKKKLSKTIVIGWNIVCLLLLFTIVMIAILSAPVPFQQFAFDQPNMGVMYFPFVWLPALVVPAVLFAHLVTLRQLLQQKDMR